MKPSTTEEVFALLDGYVTSAALGAGMELGLFWLLEHRPLDTEAIGRELGIPGRRCGYWLELLERVGLLERDETGYRPSEVARRVILGAFSSSSWSFLAGEARERMPAVGNLVHHLRQPDSTWDAQGLTAPDYFAALESDPEHARRFTRMLYEIHQPLAEALARMLDLQGVTRLFDLGGGSGVISMALQRRHPALRAVIGDIPNVCAAGREIATESGLLDRLEYLELDFRRDDLPRGFDRVLACDTAIYDTDLLGRVRDTLNPGGRLIIVDQLAPSDERAPDTRLDWAFLGSMSDPQKRYPTEADVESLLSRSGFRLLCSRPVPVPDAVRWSQGWWAVEAAI